MSEKLGVSKETGRLVVEKFLSNNSSGFFNRRFGKDFLQELTILIKGIKNAALNLGVSDAYLDFPPFSSDTDLKFSKIFPKIIKPINTDELTRVFGFNFGKKKFFKKDTGNNIVDFVVLSAFFLII